MDLSALQQTLREFAAERDWQPFHTPKNLAMALMIEAAELAEIFQWMTPEQSQAAHHDHVTQERISDEVADVLLYLLQVADHTAVDLKRAVGRKLVKNARKHPPVKPGVPVGPKDTALPQTHVLVDWENVQPKDAEIRALVSDVTDVWLFHGPSQRNVDKDQTAFGDRVTCVPISRAGKNALDFHLSFYMGYIASRNPAARFVVLSNDQGYGPMLEHAVDLGFSATLVGFSRGGNGRAGARGGARGGAGRATGGRQAPARGAAGRSGQARIASARQAPEAPAAGRPGQRGQAPRPPAPAVQPAGPARGAPAEQARSLATAHGPAREEAGRPPTGSRRRRGRGEGARPLVADAAVSAQGLPVEAPAIEAPVAVGPADDVASTRGARRGRGAGRAADGKGTATAAPDTAAPPAAAAADAAPAALAAVEASASEPAAAPAKRPARKRATRATAAAVQAATADEAASPVVTEAKSGGADDSPDAAASAPAVPAKRSRRRATAAEPVTAETGTPTGAELKTVRAPAAAGKTAATPDPAGAAEPAPAAKRTRRTAAKKAPAAAAPAAADESTTAPTEAEAAAAPVPAKKARAAKKAPARAAAKKTARAASAPAAEAPEPTPPVSPPAERPASPAPAPRREPPAAAAPRPSIPPAPASAPTPASRRGSQAQPAAPRPAAPPAGGQRQPQPPSPPARTSPPPVRAGFDLDKALRHVESSLRKTANKPARRARLLATIRSLLGQHADEANTLAVLQRLLDAGRVSIDGQGAVGYAL